MVLGDSLVPTFHACYKIGLGCVIKSFSPESDSGKSQFFARLNIYSVIISCEFSTSPSQFGGGCILFINGTVVNKLLKKILNWGDTWPVLGFRTSATVPVCAGECPT